MKRMIQHIFCTLFLSVSINTFAQDLNQKITTILFEEYKYEEPKPRAMVQYNSYNKLNVVKWASARILYLYQNTISEQIQADCMYEVSCSQYTKKMIEKKGLIVGVCLGFHQLNNCLPSAIYDYPDFMINKDEKIVNFR